MKDKEVRKWRQWAGQQEGQGGGNPSGWSNGGVLKLANKSRTSQQAEEGVALDLIFYRQQSHGSRLREGPPSNEHEDDLIKHSAN